MKFSRRALAAPSLMNSPEAFYLHLSGEQRGPYTIPQIDHLLNSGLIGQETLYWIEGLDQWQPVTNLVPVRRKPNPWIKPAWALAALVAIAIPTRVFGPVVIEGWHEANQHLYTAPAAYWRARDIVRHEGLPAGALVDFADFSAAQVALNPPQSADVTLRGELTETGGTVRPAEWKVRMRFDLESRDWSGGLATDFAATR